MTRDELLESIIADLGANYLNDYELLGALLDEIISDALLASNRDSLVKDEHSLDEQTTILSSNIRRCIKSIYLQRGTEDVSSQSLSGLSSSYDKAIQSMKDDIIKSGKRILR